MWRDEVLERLAAMRGDEDESTAGESAQPSLPELESAQPGPEHDGQPTEQPTRKATSTDFWERVNAIGMPRPKALEVIGLHTKNKVTDWAAALKDLDSQGK